MTSSQINMDAIGNRTTAFVADVVEEQVEAQAQQALSMLSSELLNYVGSLPTPSYGPLKLHAI